MHQLIESLQLLLAQTLEVERQPLRHGLAHVLRDTHAVAAGELLYALRHHHLGAGQGAVGDDDLTHRDSHTDLRPNFVGDAAKVLCVCCLECGRGQDRIGRLGELCDQRVAANLMRGTAVAGDHLGEVSESVSNAVVRDTLVLLNQCSGTHHIGMKDHGKFGVGLHRIHRAPSLTPRCAEV